MPYVSKVVIENFKSIKRADISLQGLDVLIGLNASGKSNLLSFFSMLGHVRTGNLQGFVQVRSGGASSLLFGGPSQSTSMNWRLEFERGSSKNVYSATLDYSADESLIFRSETVEALRPGQAFPIQVHIPSNSRESRMNDPAANTQREIRDVWTSLRDARHFQFHNTSYTSKLRQYTEIDSDFQIRHDGGNLAAFLLRLRDEFPDSFSKVVSSCREVIPWFDSFDWPDDLAKSSSIRLHLRERSGMTFSAHQISDGSLRLFALITLLCQPREISPDFICIDEPELGLFPAGMSKVADLMLQRKEEGVQFLLATQSRDLLRFLDVMPIVAERSPASWSETSFRRLSPAELDMWYDEYTQGAEFLRR